MQVSEYERQRMERIRRNLQVMSSLGLPTAPSSPMPQQSEPSEPPPTELPPKEKLEPTRRSGRLDGIPKPDYVLKRKPLTKKRLTTTKKHAPPSPFHFVRVEEDQDKRRSKRLKDAKQLVQIARHKLDLSSSSEDEHEEETTDLQYLEQAWAERKENAKSTTSKSPIGARKGTRELDVHIEQLQSEWVGETFRPDNGGGAMKEAVMNRVATEAPRFSKYAGAQQFQNAIVLFANVGGSDYQNVFHVRQDNLVEMDWFTSASPASELVERLCTKETSVFLFLRLVGEAYMCCGPVTVESFSVNVKPIKFRILIVKSVELLQRSSDDVNTSFQQLVNAH